MRDREYDDPDLIAEDRAARRRRARLRHWCEDCHGVTDNPNSPCYVGDEVEPGDDDNQTEGAE